MASISPMTCPGILRLSLSSRSGLPNLGAHPEASAMVECSLPSSPALVMLSAAASNLACVSILSSGSSVADLFALPMTSNSIGGERGCLCNSVNVSCLSVKEGVAEVSLLIVFLFYTWWDNRNLPHDCQVLAYQFLPLLSQLLVSQNCFLSARGPP